MKNISLPDYYFWIPGFEQRYAMQYSTGSNHLINAVYSFVYPGYRGRPMILQPKANGKIALGYNGYTVTYSLGQLRTKVEGTPAYKNRIFSITTKGTTMNLPDNYFWIPGYEQRYAVHIPIGSAVLSPEVFSFVYPGNQGRPTRLCIKNNGNYSLSKNGYVTEFTPSNIQARVQQSAAFKDRNKKTTESTTILTKGTSMEFPKNYFFIPGFNNRYIVRLADNGIDFIENVYSLVYPGTNGVPTAVNIKYTMKGKAVSISRQVGGYKDSFLIVDLIKLVKDSAEYKKYQQSQKCDSGNASCTGGCGCGSTQAKKSKGAGWIIGTVRPQSRTFSFADTPKIHETEASAYAEAERLARTKPGTRFIVLKTVREVVVGGVTVVDL